MSLSLIDLMWDDEVFLNSVLKVDNEFVVSAVTYILYLRKCGKIWLKPILFFPEYL